MDIPKTMWWRRLHNKLARGVSILLTVVMIISSGVPAFAAQQTKYAMQPEVMEELVEKYPNGLFNFEYTGYQATENDAVQTITILRMGGSTGKATVDWNLMDLTARENVDYTISPPVDSQEDATVLRSVYAYEPTWRGRIVFEEGETEKSFQVTMIDNEESDGQRVFTLFLMNATGGAVLGGNCNVTMEIKDDEPLVHSTIQFEKLEYEISRDVEKASIKVIRTDAVNSMITLKYRTKEGTAANQVEYESVQGNLAFGFGQMEQIIEIPILRSSLDDTEKHFAVELFDCKGGVLGEWSTAKITLVPPSMNQAVIEMEQSLVEVTTEDQKAKVKLLRTGDIEQQSIVEYETVDGTAKVGIEYVLTKGTVIFEAGEEEKIVEVPLLNIQPLSEVKSFVFKLNEQDGIKLGSRSSTEIVMIPMIQPEVSEQAIIQFQRPAYIVHNKASSVVVEVVRSGNLDSEVTVHYTTLDDSASSKIDYKWTQGSLVFAQGEGNKQITIPLLQEGDPFVKTFRVALVKIKGGKIGGNHLTYVTINEAGEYGSVRASSSYDLSPFGKTIQIFPEKDGFEWVDGHKDGRTWRNKNASRMELGVEDTPWWYAMTDEVAYVTEKNIDFIGISHIVVNWTRWEDRGAARMVISEYAQGENNKLATFYASKDGDFNRRTDRYAINVNTPNHIRFHNWAKDWTKLHIYGVWLEKRPYTVNISKEEGGSITASKNIVYIGDKLQITAKPDKGYKFDGFKVGRNTEIGNGLIEVDSTLLKNTLINNSGEMKITPVFKKIQVKVEVPTQSGGRIRIDGKQLNPGTYEYTYEQTLKIQADPNKGYTFKNWDISGMPLNKTNPLSLELTEELYIVSPIFESADKTVAFNFEVMGEKYDSKKHGSFSNDPLVGSVGDIKKFIYKPANTQYQVSWVINEDVKNAKVMDGYFHAITDKNNKVKAIIEKKNSAVDYKTYADITGQVLDPNTKSPVGKMKIYMGDKSTTTDDKGNFSIKNFVGTAHQMIYMEQNQYKPYVQSISLPNPTSKDKTAWIGIQYPTPYFNGNPYVKRVISTVSNSNNTQYTPIALKDGYFTVTTLVDWQGQVPGSVEYRIYSTTKLSSGKFRLTLKNTTNRIDAVKEHNPYAISQSFHLNQAFAEGDVLYAVVRDSKGKEIQSVDAKVQFTTQGQVDLDGGTYDSNVKTDSLEMPTIPFIGSKVPSIAIGPLEASVEFDEEEGTMEVYLGAAVATLKKDGKDPKAEFERKAIGESVKEHFSDPKELWEKFKEAKSGDKKRGGFKTDKETELSLKVGGKLVFIYDFDHNTYKLRQGYIVVGVNASKTWITYFFVPSLPFPVYVRTEFGVGLKGEIGLSYNEDKKGIEPALVITPEASALVAAGIGVPPILSGELWAKAAMEAELKLMPSAQSAKLNVELSMGLKATFLFLFVIEHKLVGAEYEYPDPKELNPQKRVRAQANSLFSASSDALDAISAMSVDTLKPLDRQYLDGQSEWFPKADATRFGIMNTAGGGSTQQSNDKETVIQENAYPNSNPKIVAVGEQLMLIWLADDETRDPMNRTALLYSVYDGSSWSTPAQIDNDGTADMNADIAVSGNKALITWVSIDKKLDQETHIQEILNNTEIKAIFYDAAAKTFSEVYTLTDDFIADDMPKTAFNGDIAMVAYAKTDYTDTVINYVYDIYDSKSTIGYRFWNGTTWSEQEVNPEMYKNSKYIDFDILVYDSPISDTVNTITLGFTLDQDGDLATEEDQEVYICYGLTGLSDDYVVGWTPPLNITNNTVKDANVNIILAKNDKSYIFWYSEGQLKYYPLFELVDEIINNYGNMPKEYQKPFTAWEDELQNPQIKDYSITIDSHNNVYAVWAEGLGTSQEIFTSIFEVDPDRIDNSNTKDNKRIDEITESMAGRWSKKRQITDNKAINRSHHMAVDAQGTMWIAHNKVLLGNTFDSTNEEDFGFSATNFVVTKIQPKKKISISPDHIVFSNDNPKPGDVITITAFASNDGELVAKDLYVTFYQQDALGNKTMIGKPKTVGGAVVGGDFISVDQEWTVPDESQNYSIYVEVEEKSIAPQSMRMSMLHTKASVNDHTTSTTTKLMSHPHLKLNKKSVIKGTDHHHTIILEIKNDGGLPAEKVKVALLLPTSNGDEELLQEVEVGTVGIGEEKEVTILWQADDTVYDQYGVVEVFLRATGDPVNARAVQSYTTTFIRKSQPENMTYIASMSMTTPILSMYSGDTQRLNVSIEPFTTEDMGIIWSSSNANVAEVDENGLIRASQVGEAMITASVGDIQTTCTVTVRARPIESSSPTNTGTSTDTGTIEPEAKNQLNVEPEQTEQNKTYRKLIHHMREYMQISSEDKVQEILKIHQEIAGHWAEKALARAILAGFIPKNQYGKVEANAELNRAQAIESLGRLFNLQTQEVKNPALFKDVDENASWAPYMHAAVQAGITNGINKEQFGPNEKLTREQLIVMLMRGYEQFISKEDLPIQHMSIEQTFKDSKDISPWAQKAVLQAYHLGVIKGVSTATFSPKTDITNAQLATICERMMNIILAQEEKEATQTKP